MWTWAVSEKDPEIIKEKELERKKKKEDKAREKELKRQKALEKAAKLQSEKKMVKRGGKEENPEEFLDPPTPFSEKKRISSQMAKQYSPTAVEKSWYAWWEKSGFFVADAKSSKPPFVIVLPPPNVTRALHIGHALSVAIEDMIVRWRRMSGYNTLWVPGMDHAGIATQVVVEKKIMRERKLTRHDLGREKFVSECFTMDEKSSRAVTEAFVRLNKNNLIKSFYIISFFYCKEERLVNWDCVLWTAISDIEVEHIEIKGRTLLNVPGYDKLVEFGVLTSFAYPLEGELGEIVVATTRVETMLGDTAVAIHPDDPRYNHLHGKYAIHPFNGRKLPIVCDATLVDLKFGSGAVKITPAHDQNDFEVCRGHDLESINIFTDARKINSSGGSDSQKIHIQHFTNWNEFRFQDRFLHLFWFWKIFYLAVREDVYKVFIRYLLFLGWAFERILAVGLYRGAQGNEMRLGICSRTNDVVEPLSKPQWYVNCDEMAMKGLAAVMDEEKEIEIIPRQYAADWKRWQLWWGHRVPACYVTLEDDELKEINSYKDHWVIARNEDDAQEEASRLYNGKKFHLTVLGWPDDTEDLKAFYPTSVLETGHDILFFWVARMVMLGMELGGDVPFRMVYLHPMIRDAHGRKMSKSLGNVIDPLEVISGISLEGLHKRLEEGNLDPKELTVAKEGQVKDFPNGIPECGADALRFALISYTAQSDKINLDIQRVVGYRQWCNKLWNAVRFSMSKLGDDYIPPTNVNPDDLPFSCQWILSLLNRAIFKTNAALESYKFSDAASIVYSWWQYQLCDFFYLSN
ncbi:hypothetical protein ACB092_12G204900 [Castanea dentata]